MQKTLVLHTFDPVFTYHVYLQLFFKLGKCYIARFLTTWAKGQYQPTCFIESFTVFKIKWTTASTQDVVGEMWSSSSSRSCLQRTYKCMLLPLGRSDSHQTVIKQDGGRGINSRRQNGSASIGRDRQALTAMADWVHFQLYFSFF